MSRRPRPTSARRGLTAVELIIGLVITSTVMLALGSLWYAIGESWKKNGAGQSAALTGSQAAARLEAALRDTKYVCQWRPATGSDSADSGAMVFVWRTDSFPAAPDGAVQVGELAVLQHDPVAKRLYLYQAIPYASMDTGQRSRASLKMPWAELSAGSTPGVFKTYDFVQRTVVGEAVESAAVAVSWPGAGSRSRPLIEWSLVVSRAGGREPTYAAVCVRGPATRPL